MKQLRVIAGVIISLVFLALAFRGVHLREVGEALGGASYGWLVPAVLAIVASIGLRAVRWKLLFYPRQDLRLSVLFGSLNVGYLVNDLLPLRLGEIVRACMVGQIERVSTARAFSTVAVERVLDMLVTLAFLAMVAPFVALPAGAGTKVAVVTVIAVSALAVMLTAGAMRERTHALARLGTNRLSTRRAEQAHGLLDQFLQGFGALGNLRVAAATIVLSFIIWGMAAVGLGFALLAFHLTLPPTAPIFVLALVSLSFVVPASPGYVGVFHLAVVSALAPYDVDESVALSYAFVAHLVAFVPPMVLGAWYLWRTGMSWGRVLAFGRTPTPPELRAEAEPAGRPS